MANIKYADPSFTDTNATDDDRVMVRTAAGGDARAPLVQPKGYIDGLKLEYISPTQVRVTSGAAYVPGPKRIAELASPVTLSPSLAASTWYHAYLTVAGGVVSAEASTTAPAAPYTGTARAKTGDTSRRYLGSFQTTASGAIPNFLHADGYINYREDSTSTTFRALSNGMATSSATVSLLSFGIPVTARMAKINVTNLSTDQTARMSNPDASTTNMQGVRPLSGWPMFFSLNASQQMTYFFPVAPSGGGLYLDVIGYSLER